MGDTEVPTNALFGPHYGPEVFRLDDNAEIRLDNLASSKYSRASTELEAQTEYFVGSNDERIDFRTGNSADEEPPTIDEYTTGSATLGKSFKLEESEHCGYIFRIRFSDLNDDKTPLEQLRVGRLSEDSEIPIRLEYLHSDADGYFVDMLFFESEQPVEVAAMDGAGNISAKSLVTLKVNKAGCSCRNSYSATPAPLILGLGFLWIRKFSRSCRNGGRSRTAALFGRQH